MRALLLTTCLLACAAAQADDYQCGPKRKGDRLKTDVITLNREARSGPAFYVRIDRTVVFMKPDDVLDAARAISGALVAAIAADLPLKEDTDLYKYSLRDKSFEYASKAILAILLEKGHASMADWKHIGDPSNPEVADQKIVVRTSIYDDRQEEHQRTLCTAAGDILAVPHYEMY